MSLKKLSKTILFVDHPVKMIALSLVVIVLVQSYVIHQVLKEMPVAPNVQSGSGHIMILFPFLMAL